MIENHSVLVKYNEIWNKIKKTLGMKFHSMPVYDEKYIKACSQYKLFRWWSAKRGFALHLYSLYEHWFFLKMEKKNYSQVYLEECKYKGPCRFDGNAGNARNAGKSY